MIGVGARGIHQQGQRKSTTSINQDSWPLGRKSNGGPREYECSAATPDVFFDWPHKSGAG